MFKLAIERLKLAQCDWSHRLIPKRGFRKRDESRWWLASDEIQLQQHQHEIPSILIARYKAIERSESYH